MMMPANIFPRISHTSSKEWRLDATGAPYLLQTIIPRNAVTRKSPPGPQITMSKSGAQSVPFHEHAQLQEKNQQGRKDL